MVAGPAEAGGHDLLHSDQGRRRRLQPLPLAGEPRVLGEHEVRVEHVLAGERDLGVGRRIPAEDEQVEEESQLRARNFERAHAGAHRDLDLDVASSHLDAIAVGDLLEVEADIDLRWHVARVDAERILAGLAGRAVVVARTCGGVGFRLEGAAPERPRG